ncbi:MAG: phosphoribosylglycinamide formyltransferase, partial [Deltaproteobacteria bacterium]|nr:phosphoribosylglycinamide formyltransferase [Deltaproteobacteria bacterium]
IQAVVPVLPDDDEDSLAARILRCEHRIYPEAVRLFCAGKLKVAGRKVVVEGSRAAGLAEQFLINPPLS